MDIKIIGGGPVGCYSAAILSKKHNVTIYEEHKETGKPIQCTGILTDTINEIIKLKKEFVANKIYATRVYAPNKENIRINFKKPNIIVYRDEFDKYFLDKALKGGAKINYNNQFVKRDEVLDKITNKTTTIKYDLLVGADGPLSKVSQTFGLGRRDYLVGVQAIIKKKNDNVVDFYPHIGTYAWAVPESEEVLRVGVAAEKNPLAIFKDFSKKYKGKIISMQGGIIPLHKPKLITSKEKVFLVGDAAAQIKNTTGGGLVPGLMAAEELSKAINEDKNYETLWRNRIGRDLFAHYKLRKIMNNFKEEDWNKLIKILNEDRIKEVLSKESRDKPLK
ncbi:MAG: NAD(P)/FAD-dependent oxidoreductase, partial [Nanoarchaeota archaeon]|nr:NAD(P)/FAD-dependent oxidoreductase [Nanoarchaeota archaeon]